MDTKEEVIMILDSIYAVRKRSREAEKEGDKIKHNSLMFDLLALEVCLVGATAKLLDYKEAA